MKNNLTGAVGLILSVLALSSSVHALVTMDYVTVGDPGNPADPLNSGSVPGIGSVAYAYRIGTYEVTNAQYIEFLNAKAQSDPNGLYFAGMGTGGRASITRAGVSGSFTYSLMPNMGDKPVALVSFASALRFANWMNNGQANGDTETGAYDMTQSLLTVVHASNASTWIPTLNEWYKAAYYQPAAAGGDADNYWLYPTRSNTAPTLASASATGVISNAGANVANYGNGADWNSVNGNVTTVGSAGLLSASYYGTFDQGGNVYEWEEAIIPGLPTSLRGLIGTGFVNSEGSMRSTANQFGGNPTSNGVNVGFRLASSVPEPSCVMLSLGGASAVFLRRRRTMISR